MAASRTDQELVEALKSSYQVLSMIGLQSSVELLGMIIDEVQKTTVDINYLKSTFSNFQLTTEREFGSSDHRRRCVGYFAPVMRQAMKSNANQVKQVINAEGAAEILLDRVNAYKILNDLSRIILKGADSDKDKAVGFSIAYATATEGIYKKCVQECYMWEKLSTKKSVEPTVVSAMDIPNVIDYYRTINIDNSIFEGYDKTVRNAVAHATFSFDDSTQKMRYEDRRANAAIQYSFDELHERYQKLWNVLELMLLKNQILRIHDVCFVFFQRKGETTATPWL